MASTEAFLKSAKKYKEMKEKAKYKKRMVGLIWATVRRNEEQLNKTQKELREMEGGHHVAEPEQPKPEPVKE